MFLAVGGDMIKVLHDGPSENYLSKKMSGDFRNKAMTDLQEWAQIAWMKFNEYSDTLLHRHVSLKLRLRQCFLTPSSVPQFYLTF